MTTFGNLLISGIAAGAIYAVFAACLSIWFRVCNVLNLAVGDFAMIGALGTAYLTQVDRLPLLPSAALAIVAAGVVGWLFDLVVLQYALGNGRAPAVVAIFFYTFALSFLLEGVAEDLFGTNAHAAPAIWNGPSFALGGLHVARADILVIGMAVVIAAASAGGLRFTVFGKALSACGESAIGSRIVGIDPNRMRRWVFVATAVIAALFGFLESPLTGFVFSSGPTLSLMGVVAAGIAGLQRPGRAVVVAMGLGIVEALLGGYVSTEFNDVILYAAVVLLLLTRPGLVGNAAALVRTSNA